MVLPGVGAVASQSWANPYLALDALTLLAKGATAQSALDQVLAGDDARGLRQVGLIDAAGRAVAWTGGDCTPWCGHRTGPDYAVQGNTLTGEAVVAGIETAFLDAEDSGLEERLMRALEAGQAAGGDKRESSPRRSKSTSARPIPGWICAWTSTRPRSPSCGVCWAWLCSSSGRS